MSALHALDGGILLFLQEHVRCAFLSSFLIPLTYAGEAGTIWIIISILLLFFKKTRKTGVISLLSLLVCWLFNDYILKVLVARPRPFLSVEGLVPAVKPPSSYSFPSGHANASFAAAGIYWRGLKEKNVNWLRICLLVLAFLMAFSRLYVGVHYPSDVLCGILEGTIGSTIIWHLSQQRYDRLAERNRG